MLTVGSLFAGIGGFDLGFERAGMRTVWFCEQDEFCRRVLAKHWPGVPCYPDVRALVGDAAGASSDAYADVQEAEEGASVRGAGEPGGGAVVPVQVPYVDVVCGGFPCQDLSLAGAGRGLAGERSGLWSEMFRVVGELRPRYVVVENVSALVFRGLDIVLADLASLGFDAEWDCLPASAFGAPHRRERVWIVAYPVGGEIGGAPWVEPSEGPWGAEPDVDRMVDGVPDGVDRRTALGNSLVPQIAEWIGRRIVAYEQQEGRVAA